MRKKNEGSGKIYLPAAWIRPRKLPPGKGTGRGDTFWFILRLAASASWEQGSEPPGSGRITTKKPGLLRIQALCGRWDLNPHDVTTTRSLVLLVCQFRHFRVSF